LTFYTADIIRIVGGTTAVAHSWPSIAYILFNYQAVITIGGVNRSISESSLCGGTLLDLTTVLTAAHCIVNTISYTYNGQTYDYNVVTNKFYPTFGSMYTVYLGIQDRTNLYSTGSQAKSVSTVIKVTK
jgi:V8-like Glu-specific endopeptidase